MSSSGLRIARVARHYSMRPSEMIGAGLSGYDAFCFDEALAYRLESVDNESETEASGEPGVESAGDDLSAPEPAPELSWQEEVAAARSRKLKEPRGLGVPASAEVLEKEFAVANGVDVGE